MNGPLDIDTEALVDEIERYLAAVDTFRAAGCEPAWRPEPVRIEHSDTLPPRATAPRVAH